MTRPLSAPLPAQVGETIGNYRLESVLGRGGMGCVYRARHNLLGRIAAIKVLNPNFASDEVYVNRFFHEARVVNEIRHPNIVDIIDFVRDDELKQVAYVMEFLDGPALGALTKKQRLSLVQATNLCLQLVRALASVHARSVVHRDLKPDNVIVVGKIDGDLSETPSVKIVDFGIAKNTTSTENQTLSGTILGTPAYMAPEQIAGEPVSSATDIYPLGAIYAELITGARVFAGPSLQILKQKVSGVPPPLDIPDDIPSARLVRDLVLRCLKQDPLERPSDTEVEETLSDILGEQGTAPWDQVPPRRPSREEEPAPTLPEVFEDVPQSVPLSQPATFAPIEVSAATTRAVPFPRGALIMVLLSLFVAATIATIFILRDTEAPVVVHTVAAPPAPIAPVIPEKVEVAPPPAVVEPEKPEIKVKPKAAKPAKKKETGDGPLPKRALPTW